jgi:primosomal protein N' (replication factor Y)
MSTASLAFAEVVVSAGSIRGNQTFSYSIPDVLRSRLRAGQLVLVPFGERQLHGFVVRLSKEAPVERTRDILDLVSEVPLISDVHLELACWVSEHYGAPLPTAVALVGPPRLVNSLKTHYTMTKQSASKEGRPRSERRIMELLRHQGGLSTAEIQKKLGKTAATRGIDKLVREGLVDRHITLVFPKPKVERLVAAKHCSQKSTGEDLLRRAPKQHALWTYLLGCDGPISVSAALRSVSASAAVLSGLVQRGLACVEHRQKLPYVVRASTAVEAEAPNEEAWSELKAALRNARIRKVVLQGSETDRWRLYVAAINSVRDGGRQILVIAPDVASATELAQWIAVRTGVWVTDMTRARTGAERIALWRSIRAGEVDVAVGARASVFAPFARLGLLIVDREEDAGHKNSSTPQYHVVDCAAELVDRNGGLLLLGTETPRVTTFYEAERNAGTWISPGLHEDRAPIDSVDNRSLDITWPPGSVDVVDARDASMAGRFGVITHSVYQAIRETLASQDQVVLYVNRRGTSALTVCRECAHVFQCPRCSTSLVQHRDANQLICHICNWRGPVPNRCPECDGQRLRLWGYGSEAVVEAISHLLPRARVARVDSDRSSQDIEADVASFSQGGVSILVGTQRLLSYHRYIKASLLGIIQADIGLKFPDFLAPERVFLTLMRLVRSVSADNLNSRTIVQTVIPDHYVFESMRTRNYRRFFCSEISNRRAEGLPPMRSMVKATFAHARMDTAEAEALRARRELETILAANASLDVEILGPAPAMVRRQRSLYPWHMLLLGKDVRLVLPMFHRGWMLDADPQDLT